MAFIIIMYMYAVCSQKRESLWPWVHTRLSASSLSSQEKSREEKQSAVTGRIKDALNCGLKVLDDAFEKVEVPNTPGQLIVM